jgi:hypothetical protein
MPRLFATAAALIAALALAGCAGTLREGRWATLFDGTSVAGFERLGEANWRLEDGAVMADSPVKTPAYLVTRESYGDFELRVEFWIDAKGSSGVFFRCSDAKQVGAATCYEAQIADERTDGYSTGALTNLAKVASPHPAAGRWNTYVIVAHGPDIRVALNGAVTAQIRDTKYARGPIALQYIAGVVKFRRVEIRPL